MTKELAGKIIRAAAADKNMYIRDCNTRVAKEDGKIIGAEYMYQKLHDILATEADSQENDILKIIADNCLHRFGCAGCQYRNNDTNRCRLAGNPCEWELEE